MDFNPEEKKIREVFERYRFKKPPDSLMKNYENEVLKKIKAPPSAGPGLGAAAAFSAAALLAAGLVFMVWFRPPALKNSVPAPAALQEPVSMEARPQPKIEGLQNQVVLQKMADDLFVLEMLGEDENLLGDFDRAATDVELLGSAEPINLPR